MIQEDVETHRSPSKDTSTTVFRKTWVPFDKSKDVVEHESGEGTPAHDVVAKKYTKRTESNAVERRTEHDVDRVFEQIVPSTAEELELVQLFCCMETTLTTSV